MSCEINLTMNHVVISMLLLPRLMTTWSCFTGLELVSMGLPNSITHRPLTGLGKLINLRWKCLRSQQSLRRSFIQVYLSEEGLLKSLHVIGSEVKQYKSRFKSRADGSPHRCTPHHDIFLNNMLKRSIKGRHQCNFGYGKADASCTRLG